MSSYSSSSTSSSSTSSSLGFVRKLTDSTVIGSQRREPSRKRKQQQERQVRPRVVSCNFEMKVPTNALRIDMTILVLTNDSSSCYNEDSPRPSVSYKITICTPRVQERQQQTEVHQESATRKRTTTTTTTTTTINWSSKFTMANDLDENIDPFHEWTGSFALGEKSKQKTLRMEDCSFYQLEGTFIGNYDDNNEGIESSETNSTPMPTSTSTSTLPLNQEEKEKEDLLRSSQKMVTSVTSIPPGKKQCRSSNMGSIIISEEDQEHTKLLQQQQQQQ
jgi:hypothetical protein